MTNESTPNSDDALKLAAQIVSSYVGHNQLGRDELTDLIQTVYGTLTGLGGGTAQVRNEAEVETGPLVPAVPIDQSVTPDAIICLEDGKAFKMLKRHLRTSYDMSPEEYRAKWGLSKDYPMTAPAYSAMRAKTAKSIGLGRKPQPTPKPKAKPKRRTKKT